jgi:DNA-binding transcriptional MerR regulator
MSPEVLVGEAARILAISVNHVRYLERTGQLRARRIGKYRVFLRKDVEHLAEERYRRATGQAHWRGDDTL